MSFKHFILILIWALVVVQTTASNHFSGIVTSNSASTAFFTCRTQAQWNALAMDAKNSGYPSIRIEGFNCNALDMASSAAAIAGITVLAGIYVSGTIASSTTSIDNDVQAFHAAYKKYGAGRFVGLTVGNEVNDSPQNIMAKVFNVRNYLSSIGVIIPISTTHTWINIRRNHELCGADFIGANAHAFYDGGRTSGQTGDFVFKTVVPALRAACPGKKIVITESGWPSRGAAMGVAVASIADERSALLNLNCACRDDPSVSVYTFEYDDQNWKGNDNERSFGISRKISLNDDIFAFC